jgi:putative autotransporter adhesin-like protein
MNTITIRPFATAKLLTFAALALGGCHVTGIRGNGHVTTETRTVPDFTSVEAEGAFTINWSNAPATLKITTDQNLLSRVETSVSGGKLRIHSRGQLRPTEGIQVTLSSSALSGARLSGAVRLTATKLSGKGLYLEGAGATRVVADGTVTELMATMSGASKLEAGSLQAETVALSIAGAGKAEVAASKILKVAISGAGKVTYTGNPQVEKHISGAGSVRQRD